MNNEHTFEVRTTSWHYRLICIFHEHRAYRFERDFCTYWRYVIGSIMISVVFAAIAIFVIVVGVLASIVLVKHLYMEPQYIMILPFGLIVRDMILNGIPGKSDSVSYVRAEAKPLKQPSIFSMKMKSVKSKFCPQLNVIKG